MVKEVHAAHILCKTDKKAKEVLEKLGAGQSFTEMARKYSQCPSGKSGGDLGWFGKGQWFLSSRRLPSRVRRAKS